MLILLACHVPTFDQHSAPDCSARLYLCVRSSCLPLNRIFGRRQESSCSRRLSWRQGGLDASACHAYVCCGGCPGRQACQGLQCMLWLLQQLGRGFLLSLERVCDLRCLDSLQGWCRCCLRYLSDGCPGRALDLRTLRRSQTTAQCCVHAEHHPAC